MHAPASGSSGAGSSARRLLGVPPAAGSPEERAALEADARHTRVEGERKELQRYRGRAGRPPWYRRMPYVVDFAEDRARVRPLGALVFLLSLTVVADVVLTRALRDTSSGAPPETVGVAFVPSDGVPLAERLAEPLRARLANAKGFPLEGRGVELKLRDVRVSDGFTTVCETRQGHDVLHEAVRGVCEPLLEGVHARTDRDGVAFFRDFRVVSGPPGLYTLRVECATCLGADGLPLATDVALRVRSGVGQLSVLNSDEAASWDRTFEPGRPLAFQPRVQALTEAGLPLANRTVTAVGVSDASLFSTSFAFFNTPYTAEANMQDRVALLSGATAVTDANGVATFTALAVEAYSNRAVTLGLVCGSAGELLFNLGRPTERRASELVHDAKVAGVLGGIGAVTVLQVPVLVGPLPALAGEWVAAPPAEAVEGAGVAASLRVTPARAGRRVFARVLAHRGVALSELYSSVRNPRHKHATDAVSSRTGADGVAHFDALALSVAGDPGVYTLQFVCEGVEVARHELEARSSVRTVEVLTPESWNDVGNATAALTFAYSSTQSIGNLPSFRVLDAAGNGVPGKRVEVTDDTGNFAMFEAGHAGLGAEVVTDERGIAFLTDVALVPLVPAAADGPPASDPLAGAPYKPCSDLTPGASATCVYLPLVARGSVDGGVASGVASVFVGVVDAGVSSAHALATGAPGFAEGLELPPDGLAGRVDFVSLVLDGADPLGGPGRDGDPVPEGASVPAGRLLRATARVASLFGASGARPAGSLCVHRESLVGPPTQLLLGSSLLTDADTPHLIRSSVCAALDANGTAEVRFGLAGGHNELSSLWLQVTNAPDLSGPGGAMATFLQQARALPDVARSRPWHVRSAAVVARNVVLDAPGGAPLAPGAPAAVARAGGNATFTVRAEPLAPPSLPYVPAQIAQIMSVPPYVSAAEALELPMLQPQPPTELDTGNGSAPFGRLVLLGNATTGESTATLDVQGGLPGTYGLVTAEVPSFVIGDYHEIVLRNDAARLEVEPGSAWNETREVAVAVVLPWQPRVRVLDASGAPLRGYRVAAALVDADGNSVEPGEGDLALGGALSAKSGADGVAEFRQLSVLTAAADAEARVRFELHAAPAEVRTAVLPPLRPAAGSRLDLRVLVEPPAVVSSRSPITPPPRVGLTVVGALGGDTAGVPALPDAFDEPVVASLVRVDPVTLQPDGSKPVLLGGSHAFPERGDGGDENGDADFVAEFSDVLVLSAPAGVYRWTYSLPGVSVAGGLAEVSNEVSDLQVVEQPQTAQVGGLQTASVRAGNRGGLPFPFVLVTAEVLHEGDEERFAALAPQRATVFTGADGMAHFSLVWLTGVSGSGYRIRFTAGAASAVSSPFSVYNRVGSVLIVEQPGGTATAARSAAAGVASLRQPLVRVVTRAGQAVPNEEVVALLVPPGAASASPANVVTVLEGGTGTLTNAAGEVQFDALRVPPQVPSGEYRVVFFVLGLQSEPSSLVRVHNPHEADTSSLSTDFSTLIYLTALLVIPVYMGNSTWHGRKWALGGWAVCAFFSGGGVAADVKQLRSTEAEDVFVALVLSTSLLNNALLLLAYTYVAARVVVTALGWARVPWRGHHAQRAEAYRAAASRLLAGSSPAGEAGARGDAAVLLARRDEGSALSRCLALPSAVYGAVRGRVAAAADADGAGAAAAKASERAAAVDERQAALMAWPTRGRRLRLQALHAPHEGAASFFFPQRLVFAATISWVVLFFATLGAASFSKWMSVEVLEARAFLVRLQFAANAALAPGASADAAADALGGDAGDLLRGVPAASLVGGLELAAAGQGGGAGGAGRLESMLAFSMTLLGSADADTVRQVSDAVLLAGALAAAGALLTMVVATVLSARQYRRDVYDVRIGDYSRFGRQRGARHDYDVTDAGYLPGLVIWRSLFGYALAFFVLFALLFMVQFAWFWLGLWRRGSGFVIGVVSLSAAASVLSIAFQHWAVYDGVVEHRRAFGAYEFIVLYLGLAAGILSGLFQFARAVQSLVARFARVDVESFPNDGGFEAYAAAVFLEHDVSSPAPQAAMEVLRAEVLRARPVDEEARGGGAALKGVELHAVRDDDGDGGGGGDGNGGGKAPSLDTARARLRVLFTLAHNPALRAGGMAGLEVDESQLYRSAHGASRLAGEEQGFGTRRADAEADRLRAPPAAARKAGRRSTAASASRLRHSVLHKPSLGGGLPAGWTEHFSDGVPYYFHAATETTTWDRPAGGNDPAAAAPVSPAPPLPRGGSSSD